MWDDLFPSIEEVFKACAVFAVLVSVIAIICEIVR